MADGLKRGGRPDAGTWIVGVGSVALLVAVLAAFPALHQTFDSLGYAQAARDATQLFHPHHLLYTAAVRLTWVMLGAFGATADAIAAGQIHNGIWAAVLVGATFALVRRITGSTALAGGAACLLLATRGLLVFSSQVEVYVPATACAAVLILYLTPFDAPWTKARTAGAILFLSLLILYHQPNVLVCLALPAGFALSREPGRK